MHGRLNTQFIDKYCKEFSNTIATSVFAEVTTISGKDILSVTPSKQVNLFVLKLLYTKWQDEMRSLESPFFNFKRPEVRKALVTFMNTVSQHIEVSDNDFNPLLEDALKDTINWLVDPSGYLKEEFKGRTASFNEKNLKSFLKYIKVYKNEMNEIYEEYERAEGYDFIAIAEDEFAEIETLVRAEEELKLLNEIVPISLQDILGDSDAHMYEEDEEFVNEKEVEQPEDPPEMEEIKDLEEEEDDDEKKPESHSAPLISSDSDEEEEIEEIQESSIEDDLEEEEESETEIEEDLVEEQVEEEPESINGSSEEEDERDANSMVSSKPTNTINEQFSEKEEPETVAKEHQDGKIESIMDAISVNHRYMFVKELFDGSREQFTSAVKEIEECESFDGAVEMLVQNYAKDNAWDMNSDEVKELLKVVFRRFRK